MALSTEDQAAAMRIRREVFVEEQRVPADLEQDLYDATATHFLLTVEDEPVATGRFRIYERDFVKFERIATRRAFRGQGLGALLMNLMESSATTLHPHRKIFMHAQESAVPFYERLGYTKLGDRFFEAGIPHFSMVK